MKPRVLFLSIGNGVYVVGLTLLPSFIYPRADLAKAFDLLHRAAVLPGWRIDIAVAGDPALGRRTWLNRLGRARESIRRHSGILADALEYRTQIRSGLALIQIARGEREIVTSLPERCLSVNELSLLRSRVQHHSQFIETQT